MSSRTHESQIEQHVYQQLLQLGWSEADILQQVVISHNGRQFVPDMILLHNLYPFAIVEVKGPHARNLQNASEQALLYASALEDVPFALITDGRQVIRLNISEGQITELSNLPAPRDLWESLGRAWDENDPRLYLPIHRGQQPARFHQAQAVSRIIDNIVGGKRRNLVVMVSGSGHTLVLSQIVWKLINSDYLRRALVVTDRWELAYQVYDFLKSDFEQDVLLLRRIEDLSHISPKVHITVIHSFFGATGAFKQSEVAPDYYDLIVIDSVERTDLLGSLLKHFHSSYAVGFTGALVHSSKLIEQLGTPIYTYALKDMLSREPFQPPVGFNSVPLEDIADIISRGMNRTKNVRGASNITHDSSNLHWIGVRDIQDDGSLNLANARTESVQNIQLNKLMAGYGLRPQDIVVNAYSSGRSRIQVGIVPETLSELMAITSSLIRIRIDPERANPLDVFQFLRSDTGQMVLRSYASGSAVSGLSIQYLRQMPIFLPKAGTGLELAEELTAAARALKEIEEQIVPLLKGTEKEGLIDENTRLFEVGERLKAIATSLVPPSLSEKVTQEFPTPIALAYQRFQGAKFNIYEQVQRLKDVFEAIGFFVYNSLLADALNRLDPEIYFIADSKARRAYKSYSMAHRLGFVEAIQQIAKKDGGQSLFIPELVEFDVKRVRRLQNDLRNEAAHTATAPEQAQQIVVGKFQPLIEAMLNEMSYLSRYSMVRIPSFYYRHGGYIRRMEVYRGVMPYPEEILIEKENLIAADHEHLVLLNDEEQVLDLYPMYQFVASERTNYERHICFLKQCKDQEKLLEGESVQGAFTVEMSGFDEFKQLQARILNELPDKRQT